MREMKDSGIEWIGEIPVGWEIIKLKMAYVSSNAGEVIDKSFWNSGNELLYTCQKTPMMSNFMDFPFNKRTTDDDLLLTRNATPYIFIPEGNAIYSNVVQRITISSKYERRFVRYALQCGIEALTVQGDTIPSYNMQVWNNVYIPNIPRPQQHRISTYLDTKCEKIDSIIARQQEVIEKLKAYKLSVITEAVTKGLNPDVRMKDSGVEWIGDVPEHWRIIRLKFLLTNIIDCPHETPNYSFEGNYHVIRTADQDYGFLRSDDNMYRLDEDEYQKRIRRLSLDKDDIVYGREGERWGLACIVPESKKYCLGQRMMQFRCNTTLIIPKFAMWALNSKYVYLQGSVDTIGSTSPHVNISTMRNYFIPTPPIEEQKIIMDYLDKKCSAIDSAIAKKQAIIEKLTAYKKSLIYEVVTGKREV